MRNLRGNVKVGGAGILLVFGGIFVVKTILLLINIGQICKINDAL